MAPTKTRLAYSEDDLQRAVNAVKEDGITFAKQSKITSEQDWTQPGSLDHEP